MQRSGSGNTKYAVRMVKAGCSDSTSSRRQRCRSLRASNIWVSCCPIASLRMRRSSTGWTWRRRIGIGWLRCFKDAVDWGLISERIWQVCVQTSQTYGLVAVGITEAGLKKLHIQTMKHARAFAKSPRHITRESDEELLGRLGVRRPQEMLLKQLDGMIQRHGASTGLPCFGRDALLDWLALQRASLERLGGAVRELPGHRVANGMGQETEAASGVVLNCRTQPHSMRVRYVASTLLVSISAASAGSPSRDGLRYSATSATIAARDFDLLRPMDVPLVEHDPGLGVEGVGPLWYADESLPKSDLHPVIKWESVLQLPQPRRWEQIAKLPRVVDYLRQRCGLCGQWIAKTNGARKHLQEVHRLEWELHRPRIEHWARSWSRVITRPCPVCAAAVVDIRQHGGSCVVMQQAALIQLCLAGPSGDERAVQSHANTGLSRSDGRPRDGACASEEAEARGSTDKAQAAREGQRCRQRKVTERGGLLRFFGPACGGQAAGTACPSASRGPEQVTLVCLIKELAARAEVTFKTPDARRQAEGMGLLEGEAWVYQVWDSQKQTNIRDTTRKPLPIADFQAQMETLQKYVMTEGLTRFQALKVLTEDLADTQVPFLLDVSLREPAMHELLLSWAQLGVFGLIGGRLRRSRVRRGPQQEKVYELLQSL